VTGTVGSQTNIDASDPSKPMLVVKGLAPGKYRFKYVYTITIMTEHKFLYVFNNIITVAIVVTAVFC